MIFPFLFCDLYERCSVGAGTIQLVSTLRSLKYSLKKICSDTKSVSFLEKGVFNIFNLLFPIL